LPHSISSSSDYNMLHYENFYLNNFVNKGDFSGKHIHAFRAVNNQYSGPSFPLILLQGRPYLVFSLAFLIFIFISLELKALAFFWVKIFFISEISFHMLYPFF
jgi:hypothetical protein